MIGGAFFQLWSILGFSACAPEREQLFQATYKAVIIMIK